MPFAYAYTNGTSVDSFNGFMENIQEKFFYQQNNPTEIITSFVDQIRSRIFSQTPL